MDDSALYCLEMTEKAFRSQGLALSEPVRIGDWENLTNYPLTALAIPSVSGLVVDHPITLEQPVYLPGNERHGVWASPLLETVFGPESMWDQAVVLRMSQPALAGGYRVACLRCGRVAPLLLGAPGSMDLPSGSAPRVRGTARSPRS